MHQSFRKIYKCRPDKWPHLKDGGACSALLTGFAVRIQLTPARFPGGAVKYRRMYGAKKCSGPNGPAAVNRQNGTDRMLVPPGLETGRAAAECVRHKAGCMEIVLLGGRIIAKSFVWTACSRGQTRAYRKKASGKLICKRVQRQDDSCNRPFICFFGGTACFCVLYGPKKQAGAQEEFCLTNRRLWDMINAMAVKRTSRPRRIRCRESLFGGKGPESAC